MASTSSQGGSKFISFDGRSGKRYKPKSWNSNEDLLQDKNTHMSSQALQRVSSSFFLVNYMSRIVVWKGVITFVCFTMVFVNA